jgi:uncharacterized damage-inducible protein DinB
VLKAHLLAQLDREVPRSRKVLQQMPDGKGDWKPHGKSMAFEYLAHLVAIMPSWVTLQVNLPELDIAPKDGSSLKYEKKTSSADYVRALDQAAAEARTALTDCSEEHLALQWQLKAAGHVVQQDTRANMIQDTLNHWSHHRGQMTVYLRLLGATVPSTYGPSADEKSF